MRRLTLPLLDAKEMAKALDPHISRDNVTPALTGIVVGGERHGQFAYATDRYSVGQFDLTNVATDPLDEELWIPRAALGWVSTIGPASLLHSPSNYVVRFEAFSFDGVEVVIVTVIYHNVEGEEEVHLLRRFLAPMGKGAFPLVSRLFTEFLPGEAARFGVQGQHLDKFTGYAKSMRNGTPMRVTMPATHVGGPAKPILIEIGGRFKGLIQPVTLVGGGFGNDIAEENRQRDIQARQEADAQPKEQGNAEGD